MVSHLGDNPPSSFSHHKGDCIMTDHVGFTMTMAFFGGGTSMTRDHNSVKEKGSGLVVSTMITRDNHIDKRPP